MLSPTAGAPPREQRSGPQIAEPGSRLNAEVAAKATVAALNVTPQSEIVSALAYEPDRRRTRWLLILEACPGCALPHQFYGSPSAPPRRRSCSGKKYLLHAVYAGEARPAEVSR